MELSQRLLCLLFLASFGAGGCLGGVFDLLRMSRLLLMFPRIKGAESQPTPSRRAKWNRRCQLLLLFVEDMLFALLCGMVMILLLYFLNDGKIRWLAPVGMACGFFAYMVTIGKLIQKCLAWLTRVIRRLLGGISRFLWRALSFPIKAVCRLIKRVVLTPVKYAWIRYCALVKETRIKRQNQKNTDPPNTASADE